MKKVGSCSRNMDISTRYKIRIMMLAVITILMASSCFANGKENDAEVRRKVVAAFPQKFPPHCFLDDKGVPTGFAIDVMNEIARLANLEVEYKPEYSFVDAVNSLDSGAADLIVNSGVTADRLLEYDFTIPIETFQIVIFVRQTTKDINTLDDLEGRKVAVLPTNVGERIVKGRPNITGVIYQEISTAIFDLLAGKVDAFIYPKPPVIMLAREANIEDRIQISGDPLLEVKRAIRVRKGDPLLAHLNQAIGQLLGSKKYQGIYLKWYGKPQPLITPGKVAVALTILFSIIFLILLVWRYKSMSQVTGQLKEEVVIRKKVELELREHQNRLENLVEERTKELKEREMRFRTLSEAAFEGIVFSEKGVIIESNDSLRRMTGYEANDLVGMEINTLLVQNLNKNGKKSFGDEIKLPVESECSRRDGSRFQIELRWRPIPFHGKDILVWSIRDVSARKESEKNLEESRAMLQEAQHLAHIGSWSLDIPAGVLEWSDEVYQIFEISKEDFPASYDAFLGMIHPEDREMVHCAYNQSLTEKTSYSVGHRLLMKDGRIKYIHEHGESSYDYNGNPVRSVGTVQDITNRRLIELELQRLNDELENRVSERTMQLEEANRDIQDTQRALMNIVEDLHEKSAESEEANIKLKGLDRLKSMFIASMSHELRTPLNSIIGFSSILLDEWLGTLNDEQKTKLAIVLRTGKHLLTLINDVIDVSKIEAGKMDTSSEDFDIVDLVDEALELVKKDLEDKELSLKAEVNPISLHTDRRRVFQCMVNLLSNAVKFTEHGTITIKTDLLKSNEEIKGKKDCLQFTVIDTGVGIGEEDLPRLFTAFTRFESPSKDQEKGTGLGLYLVKKITEEILMGEVGVKSTIGKGSSFYFIIPIVKETEEKKNENSSRGRR